MPSIRSVSLATLVLLASSTSPFSPSAECQSATCQYTYVAGEVSAQASGPSCGAALLAVRNSLTQKGRALCDEQGSRELCDLDIYGWQCTGPTTAVGNATVHCDYFYW